MWDRALIVVSRKRAHFAVCVWILQLHSKIHRRRSTIGLLDTPLASAIGRRLEPSRNRPNVHEPTVGHADPDPKSEPAALAARVW